MEDHLVGGIPAIPNGNTRVSGPDFSRRTSEAGGRTDQTGFQQALEAQLQKTSEVAFSRHAVNRAIQRNLDLSEDNIARLNEGVRLAAEKKLRDPLILIDRTAFLVNIKHYKVITTVDAEELRGNVFTNIDGTVIM